jgi:hypothetical protein
MRCASRAGRMERVKLAEVSNCCVVSGGFPCLTTRPSLARICNLRWRGAYLTRSARVRGYNGKLASREMSLSVTVAVWSLRFGSLANGPPLVLRLVRGQHSRMMCDWIINGR